MHASENDAISAFSDAIVWCKNDIL